MFRGFDGLMTLSRREGVDIRPTLLRVLTDLYVQAAGHSHDEERQFVELASRLIDEVDDATRAAVRARLSIYPHTPHEIARKLKLASASETDPTPDVEVVSEAAAAIVSEPPAPAPSLTMQPGDAAQLVEMFLAADSGHRARVLHGLRETTLRPSPPVDPRRAKQALARLEHSALAADAAGFTAELADALILPARTAEQIVAEPGGEALACALKALDMPAEAYQRVLLFLDPARGASVTEVYRLARLYDVIEPRAALIMLAAWRGTALAVTRAKYRPALHDDERQRARAATAPSRPGVQPGAAAGSRTVSNG
jgi:hypothetical protein